MLTACRAHSRRLGTVVWLLLSAGCGADGSASRGDLPSEFAPTSAGRLNGTVLRRDGSPAAGLTITSLIHGAPVAPATITDGAGAFTVRIINSVATAGVPDTALTVFVNGQMAVGSVSDSLVLREPVIVRMSANLASPVVTTVQLQAAY